MRIVQYWPIPFFRKVFRPLKVIPMHGIAFFIWIVFTAIGGLVGAIVSIIRHMWVEDLSFGEAVLCEGLSGVFYTYSIAMVAASLSSVFIVLSEHKELSFRKYQIPTIAISIFTLFFGGVLYALSMEHNKIEKTHIVGCDIDWAQIIVVFVAVAISIYAFCISRLDKHKKEFADIRDVYFDDEKYMQNQDITTLADALKVENSIATDNLESNKTSENQ